MNKIFDRIYEIVREIPKGKVTTYGVIGKIVGTSPRVVGWALHANRDRGNPCHRVINRDGKLAPRYVFGGEGAQKRRLLAEGVEFKNNSGVDLDKFLISVI